MTPKRSLFNFGDRMQDSADQMMSVWLNLPKRMESLTEHTLKNDTLQFDLMQPAMKGIAKSEDGDQIPFMCIRVHVIRNQAIDDDTHSVRILNTFNRNGKWQTNISGVERPNFTADEYSDQLLPKVQTLFVRGNFTLPMMHVQAV